MNKIELLAPVGDFESLKMAVYYGANAVYLGIKEFNARNNIKGFSIEDLKQAVDFAHIYGVKVYLTLNILLKDSELQEALDIVCDANNLGVDAFIIQDLGLAGLIQKYYPSIELHASTQMAIHNLEGVKILEKLGFKRVVLARETPLNEIERIHKNSDIEIEFFVQGALCVSFSGNCYMCSHLVNKSGNRGVCQQFCRLPYTFECGNVRKTGYLLSAKDICMLDKLDDLKRVGVISLKIEGRARRPFYVAQACKVYRQALDNIKISQQDLDNLEIAFNRQFTPAYFNGNNNIISKIQGNNGIKIGEVVKVNNGKKFNEIFIKTNYNLTAPCGLKFIYNGEEECSIGACDIKKVDKTYRVTTTAKIKIGSEVNLIQDENLEQQVLNYQQKLKIDIELIAQENKPLVMRAKYNDLEVEEEFGICQLAKTININNEQVLKQLSRSNVFEINLYKIELNNCYILNSAINNIRNKTYQKLQDKILEKYQKIKLNKIKLNNLKNNAKLNKIKNNLKINRGVCNIEYDIKNDELDCISQNKFKIINSLDELKFYSNIIYDFKEWNKEEILKFNNFCVKNNCKGYIDIPNFATNEDIEEIKSIINSTSLGVVANNLYALSFNCNIIGGQFLNVYNNYALKVLQNLHDLDALFVEEIDVQDIDSEIPILKREKVYMTLIHCPFKQHIGGNCLECKFNNAKYIMGNGRKFKVYRKKIKNCIFLLKD